MNTRKLEKAVDLRQALQRPSPFPGGFHRVAYPTDRFDLRAAAAQHVAMGGYTETPCRSMTCICGCHRKRSLPRKALWAP